MSARPSDAIDDHQSPRCFNVHFKFGEVRSRPGSGIVSGSMTAEAVRWLGTFHTIDNTAWTIMLQETKMHRLGNVVPGSPYEWHEVLPTAGETMTYSKPWSVTSGEGYLFFAGDDEVYRWSGTGAYGYIPVTEGAAIWDTSVRARFIEYFNNRLVLAYTTEAGASVRSQRVRWPEGLNHALWDDTLEEGAGFIDLYEEGEQPITGLKSLQDRLMVYKPKAIMELMPTGTLAPEHVAQTRIRGTGCAAPYTLASTGSHHFFLGEDQNVYLWDGIALRPIGDVIREELQSATSPANFENYIGIVAPTRDEYWLVVEDDNVFVYDWRRDVWTRDTFPSLTALGEVDEITGSVLWSGASGTWAAASGGWDDQLGTPHRILYGGRSDGATIKIDEQFIDDYFAVGSIIDKHVETKDYYFGDDQLGTLHEVLLSYEYLTSDPVEVGVSFDRGSTWITSNITPSASGYSKVNFTRTGNVVRFRFRDNSASGRPRWKHFSFEFVPAGPYRP